MWKEGAVALFWALCWHSSDEPNESQSSDRVLNRGTSGVLPTRPRRSTFYFLTMNTSNEFSYVLLFLITYGFFNEVFSSSEYKRLIG
jgi:hypothetical protein